MNKNIRLFFIILFFQVLNSDLAHSYPNFIGYSYTTCITCHFNSLGGGPLNDYGRALFSQEIAGRWGTSEKYSDEELADRSGFIPGKETPYWFKPGIKFRGLWFQTNPTGSNSLQKYFNMQREINLALQSDAAGTWRFVVNWNLLPEPRNLYNKCTNNENCVKDYFRELYIQHRFKKNYVLSLGVMDKAYGLRLVDHTSYSRSSLRVGQYDQSTALQVHIMQTQWDVALQYLLGNSFAKSSEQEKGFSGTGEYEIAEKQRLGASVMQTQTESNKYLRFGLHGRHGLIKSPGSAFLWELGMLEDAAKDGTSRAAGTYAIGETLINIKRGVNLLSTFERLQTQIQSSTPEKHKWTMGFLLFPLQRTELRLTYVQSRSYASTVVTPETSQLQGQIHVSW